MEVQDFVKKLTETEEENVLVSLLSAYKNLSDFQKEKAKNHLAGKMLGNAICIFSPKAREKKIR